MAIYPLFHEQLRDERERRNWSQADLAERVRCDTKTISRWESGERLPRPYHRQILCEIFDKNAVEFGLVRTSSPSPNPETTEIEPARPTEKDMSKQDSPEPEALKEDWGEAPYIEHLYGRETEIAELKQWIEERSCHIGAILGMGGAGKTAVTTTVAMQTKQAFRFLFWRSLQDAPPFEYFLRQCISFVSDQQHVELPGMVDDQISLLISYLQKHRCLLVLDNFESILQKGRSSGHYRDGYTPYGRLLQRIGETRHQSCLLITSREKPREIAYLEGKDSPVQALSLAGLDVEAGKQILKNKALLSSHAHWTALVEHYSGNPLALQIVSEYIREVFAGDIVRFLQKETIAFGDINSLLDQQFYRLSAQEQEIMYWLAIEREAIALENLGDNLAYAVPTGVLLEELNSLLRRSLIEKKEPAQFALQPVILEYVTTNLIRRAELEFETEITDVWMRYAFIKAQAKEYIRESQERLILSPLAHNLLARLGKEDIEQRANAALLKQRRVHTPQTGYLAGNLLNFLNYAGCELRGFDFSHLVVRQAYLQNATLPAVNFAHTRFIESTFTNTFGNVLSIACSSEKALLAAGTTSGEIRVYDLSTFALRLICHGHTDGVWALAFNSDGTLLASSSDDQTIRLWNSSSGNSSGLLQGHTSRVRTIAFSSDGSLLASGSDDSTIRIWAIPTGECLMKLMDHMSRVWSVAFHPDGNLLASGSTDQTVRIWDLSTGRCQLTLSGHNGSVRSVAFHPQENILASGSDDRTIRLWNSLTGQHFKTFTGHINRVWSIAFSLDGSTFASGSEDQTIRIWNISTGESSMLLQGHTQGVRSIAFVPGKHILVSGGDDQTIRLWNSDTRHCLQTLQGYTHRIWSLAFSPDGKILASGSDDSAIRLWDSKTGRCLKVIQDRRHGVLVLTFGPAQSRLASGGQDQTIRIWDLNTGHCLAILRGHTNWVRAIAFSPDGKMLASGSEDQTIRIWDVETASCLYVLQGHSSWVRSVAFSPDGKILASGADDHTIRLWNIAEGRCFSTLQGHIDRVRAISFSPDGKLLASGSEDQTIHIWDLNTGHSIHKLQSHNGWVRSLAFSSDGNVLASGNEDQTIRLWDRETWQCLQMWHGHSSRVRQVIFNPDSSLLASSSDDGTIKLWDRQTATLLKTLISEKPYEQMNITGVQGLSTAEKSNLEILGAIEDS